MWFLVINIIFLLICAFYCIIEPEIRQDKRKFIVLFFSLIFSLLIAFRPEEIKDTGSYIRFFNKVELNTNYGFRPLHKYDGIEYGFLYLVLIFKSVFTDYRILFFLIAGFNTIISVSCLQRIQYYILSLGNINQKLYGIPLLGYMAYAGIMYCGIAMRAGISLSLGLLAIDYYLRKKYGLCLIIGFIAFLFHRASIVILFAILINAIIKRGRLELYLSIWFLQGILLVINIGDKIIDFVINITLSFFEKLEINGFTGYLNNYNADIGKIDWLMWGIIGILILFHIKNKYYDFFLKIVLLAGWIIVFLHGIRAISRLYDYCMIFAIPLLGANYYSKIHIKINGIKIFTLFAITVFGTVTLKLSFF